MKRPGLQIYPGEYTPNGLFDPPLNIEIANIPPKFYHHVGVLPNSPPNPFYKINPFIPGFNFSVLSNKPRGHFVITIIQNRYKMETRKNLPYIYPKISAVSASFNVTFLLLLGTTAATIIGAVYPGSHSLAKNKILADILIVESVVNFIATYFYSLFVKDAASGNVQEESVTTYRYMDWALTTPFLLIAISLYAEYLNREEDPTRIINWSGLGLPILLNWAMLTCGYLGESGTINRTTGLVSGFVFFGLLLLTFWNNFVVSENSKKLFIYFIISWGLYGVMYMLPSNQKTIGYNLLDLVSKVGLSLFTLGTIFSNNAS